MYVYKHMHMWYEYLMHIFATLYFDDSNALNKLEHLYLVAPMQHYITI